ncbi:ParB N-terminal domain-containing protein [Streptomyces mirabilis]|uniref:ParB N-terminal domain-containing protein n=1 Tax=Streptomyces mirabilis TaxID=68239 RepID=UPI0036AE654D
MTDTPTATGLSRRIVRRDPRLLTRLQVNAHYQTKEEFDRLVDNIKEDGCLTSVPLNYGGGEYDEGRELVVSGNHRCDAAVVAGLEEIDVMLIEDAQTKDQLIARQLSHNAITGKDDPATLQQLYDQIDDVDWRAYSGLDDDQLKLLASCSSASKATRKAEDSPSGPWPSATESPHGPSGGPWTLPNPCPTK